MINSLISALGLELGLTSQEIADVVWLALQMQEVDRPAESIVPLPEAPAPEPQLPNRSPVESADRSNHDQPSSTDQTSEPQAGLYSPEPEESAGMAGALALNVPDARSLREPLALARALKPLLRKVVAGYGTVLDEAATVERIADEKVWLPVLKPSLEPWLDLALVVDENVSMQIWGRTIGELRRLMEHYGVFRDVRVWGLVTVEGKVRLRPGLDGNRQALRRPSELIDPSGRRLVLVVTDCVAAAWRDGTMQPALKLWGTSGPMAIVQMLPEWLWARTGLGFASAVRLQGLEAGVPNQQLQVRDLSAWDEVDVETGIKVPVVTLEPEPFGAWAQMVTGKGGVWAAGVVFDREVIGETALQPEGNLDGVQRVQRFRVTASPMARRLAGLLAAAPVISLPVVRIIQERLLPESRQVHVAEVFLGGLLCPLVEITAETNVDAVQYEFWDGAREALLDGVRTSESVNVLNEVSQFVAERLGVSIDQFTAVLRNPKQSENPDLVENIRPFAIVVIEILRKLGGEFTKVANILSLKPRGQYIGWDLSELNLEQIDLQEANLKNALLKGTNLKQSCLRGADLTYANLEGANLRGAHLENARLEHVDLYSANLQDSILKNTALDHANLDRANLRHSDLSNASIKNASMKNASMKSAMLFKVNLSGSNLKASSLNGASLSHSNLRNANLELVDFDRSLLKRADLSNTNLSNSSFRRADLSQANLKNAVLINSNLHSAKLSSANLQGANLKRANLRGANLENVNLQGANLELVDFERSLLKRADLSNTNLSNSSFRRADLSQANLKNAVLINSKLSSANLQGANLKGANLRGANLENVNLQGANFEATDLRDVKIDPQSISSLFEGSVRILITEGIPINEAVSTVRDMYPELFHDANHLLAIQQKLVKELRNDKPEV